MNNSISIFPLLIVILLEVMVSWVNREKTFYRLRIDKFNIILLLILVNCMLCLKLHHIFYKSFHDNFHSFLRIWILPELCEIPRGLNDPLLGHVFLLVKVGVFDVG